MAEKDITITLGKDPAGIDPSGINPDDVRTDSLTIETSGASARVNEDLSIAPPVKTSYTYPPPSQENTMATKANTSTATADAAASSDLGATLKTDALGVVATPINAFFDAIIANPTSVNVLLQANALQASLIASSPALEGVGIKDVAVNLKTQFNSLLSSGDGSAS